MRIDDDAQHISIQMYMSGVYPGLLTCVSNCRFFGHLWWHKIKADIPIHNTNSQEFFKYVHYHV